MRRVLVSALAILSVATAAAVVPSSADAQGQQRQRPGQPQAEEEPERRPARLGVLRQRANAGPCPFVKVLYDAARYVEMADNRPALANIGYTGEIQGVTSGCSYRDDDPIRVEFDALFYFGRGAQATADRRTYRYWVAVTERNTAVLDKQYFEIPVDFEGRQTATAEIERTVIIPRAATTVSGSNFEILIGFDVTPDMAAFNRDGSRFRVNAGATAPATPPAQ
jgi:hypothetical protein